MNKIFFHICHIINIFKRIFKYILNLNKAIKYILFLYKIIAGYF